MWPIVDKLHILAHRLRKPRTIEDALRQLITPSFVDEKSSAVARSSELIELIAKDIEIEAAHLLRCIAHRFEIPPAESLAVPSRKLVLQTGFDIDLMRQLELVPQESLMSPFGYSLVVANPEVLNIRELQKKGIGIQLSTGRAIFDAWKKFDWQQSAHASVIGDQEALQILDQLIYDAGLLGAADVFLGQPDSRSYEFIALGHKYSGKLHPSVIPLLAAKLGDSSRHIFTSEKNSHLKISFSCIQDSDSPILYVTWNPPGISAEPAKPTEETTAQSDSSGTEFPISTPAVAEPSAGYILLIDDDECFQTILGRVLENRGWKVKKCSNGNEALTELEQSDRLPNLAVCDVHMPNLDGISFLRQLRQKFQDLPVLMLTSDDDRLLEAEAALLGADAFIRKSEDPKILVAWCTRLLQRDLSTGSSGANGDPLAVNGD